MMKSRKTKTPAGTAATLVELTGSLDANFAEEFREKLAELEPAAGGRYAFGFEGVRYICSRVLGSTLGFSKELRAAGGHVVLYAVPEKIRTVMEVVTFHAFFRICEDEAEALAVLAGNIPEEEPLPPSRARRLLVAGAVIAALAAVAGALALVLVRYLDGLF